MPTRAAQVSVDGPGTGDGFVPFCEGPPINDAPCDRAGGGEGLQAGRSALRRARDRPRRHHRDDEPREHWGHRLNKGDPTRSSARSRRASRRGRTRTSLAQKVGGNGNFPTSPVDRVG
jgi:hypothetical protein